jgi:hypothetical protein
MGGGGKEERERGKEGKERRTEGTKGGGERGRNKEISHYFT